VKLTMYHRRAKPWRERQQLARTGWLPIRPTVLRYKGRLVGVGLRVLRQLWLVDWLPRPTRRELELENAQLRLEKARVLAVCAAAERDKPYADFGGDWRVWVVYTSQIRDAYGSSSRSAS